MYSLKRLCPYEGYELDPRTSTDLPVKIVESLAQHKWSSKFLNILFLQFNILQGDVVCLNWKRVVRLAWHIGAFDGNAYVNIKTPRWWHLGSAETCNKWNSVSSVSTPQCMKICSVMLTFFNSSLIWNFLNEIFVVTAVGCKLDGHNSGSGLLSLWWCSVISI